MSDSWTLAELAEESGIPARTIRFYISRGLLDGPVKAGRGAMYAAAHLERLEKIRSLQAEGHVLSEIVHLLGGGAVPAAMHVTPWWQHVVGDDLMVLVRGDISPWRMKQIRAAIDRLAAQIAEPESENGKPGSHRK